MVNGLEGMLKLVEMLSKHGGQVKVSVRFNEDVMVKDLGNVVDIATMIDEVEGEANFVACKFDINVINDPNYGDVVGFETVVHDVHKQNVAGAYNRGWGIEEEVINLIVDYDEEVYSFDGVVNEIVKLIIE